MSYACAGWRAASVGPQATAFFAFALRLCKAEPARQRWGQRSPKQGKTMPNNAANKSCSGAPRRAMATGVARARVAAPVKKSHGDRGECEDPEGHGLSEPGWDDLWAGKKNQNGQNWPKSLDKKPPVDAPRSPRTSRVDVDSDPNHKPAPGKRG